jgi:hypothetical protein
MNAVISILDKQSLEKVDKIRKLILEQCDFPMPPMTLEAHISWHGADEYNLDFTKTSIVKIAKQYEPFSVRTGGLGLFTGNEPIFHLNVSRSPIATEMHLNLWKTLMPTAINPNHYFSPQTWVPHITLFYGDKDNTQSLVCGLGKLIDQEIDMDIFLDHLAIAFYKDGIYGVESIHPLGKKG